MEPKKLKLLMKTFVVSQFRYCPLIWMFQDIILNNKINGIQERTIRIAIIDISNFEDLLEMEESADAHGGNLQN